MTFLITLDELQSSAKTIRTTSAGHHNSRVNIGSLISSFGSIVESNLQGEVFEWYKDQVSISFFNSILSCLDPSLLDRLIPRSNNWLAWGSFKHFNQFYSQWGMMQSIRGSTVSVEECGMSLALL
ncbi:hypothetical protein DFH28DRAFT_96307 [Melampsora americana]|nr:hypothetical protein DFH28DRAFT_96307 [Melampsora americana]